MAGNFQELLKKAETEKRIKAGLDPLPEESEEILPEENQAGEEEQTEEQPPVHTKPRHGKPKSEKKGGGFLRFFILLVLIVSFCCGIAFFTVAAALDFSGLNKSDAKRDVVIPKGASTEAIATVLQENKLIDHPLIFRLYSRFAGKDGKFQAGEYSLSANMGYQNLCAVIIAGNPRETVTVTIPEGFTIDQIAKRLEENNVCTTADFYDALNNEVYDYDFFESIPTANDGDKYAGRIYRLEGYLFPDTYEFYTQCGGKTVVDKFLSNFASKITPAMKSAMQARSLTLDDVVIMASIAQKESANTGEMAKVTKVLYNRLDSDYTRLECDSTALYVKDLMPNIEGFDIKSAAYNTYVRAGLTAGAICNPGLHALEAAVYPSDDEYVSQCYYFANDKAGNTYYSKTFAQHEAVCRRYGIGAYG